MGARIRDFGIFPGVYKTGPNNAITDVSGVRVGHVTLREDGAVTGVTAVLHTPHEKLWHTACFAGSHVLNGYGQVTGRDWIDESGLLGGPVILTSFFGVGAMHQGLNRICPDTASHGNTHHVIAETWDGWLTDPSAEHIRPEHAQEAIDAASDGIVAEGCVGGGTGMVAFDLKSGIGTASRQMEIAGETYTLGVLVQSNFGDRHSLLVDGAPLGRQLDHELLPLPKRKQEMPDEDGSIIIILATDAPLLPTQCSALARRTFLGMARTGAIANNGSGDFALAFSTGNQVKVLQKTCWDGLSAIPQRKLNPLFQAAVETTEEAILNALCAAETTCGFKGRIVHALPHELLARILNNQGLAHEPKNKAS